MVVYFSFLLHIYQPPIQIPPVIKQIVNESYRPIMDALRDHPEAKITLNINGTLTEQLNDYGYTDLIEIIAANMQRIRFRNTNHIPFLEPEHDIALLS